MRNTIRHLALGLFPALLVFGFAGLSAAQEAPEDTAAHTITLTKVVDVYEFEDLKVSLDQYQVGRGDALLKILKSRGLLAPGADTAQMLRLVRNLNPELADLDAIQPGQVLNLPAELKSETEGEETPPADPAQPVEPATITETVKVYERPQPNQQSARVVVMRHRPGPGAVEVAEGAQGAGTGAEAAEAPAGASALDFPSGNHGPLALEPDSGVVYRTVQICRGDTLERLLRREGMDNGLIYAHLLKVTLQLNPEIKNQDLIFAGAELRIPAAGDYLAAMAGVDPGAVKAAALARSQGRGPAPAGVLRLPRASIETAKATLGLIFTRLGARMDTRGRLVVPGGSGLEFNTAEFPLVELPGERRVVLDLEGRLPRQTLAGLRALPGYQVFRPAAGEPFEKALGGLWPLCGFYRVYTIHQVYEGGTDIRLAIAADWLIWPTGEAWKNGRPLALNLAVAPDQRTDPGWKAFLAGHGVEVLDLFQGAVLPDEAAPAAPPLQITRLTESNPSLLAAELVRLLGAEPRVGVQLDGLSQAGGEESTLTAPVLWTDNSRQVALDFGELDPEAVKTLRESEYLVVTTSSEPDKVVGAVLEGFGLASHEALVLKAPPGGPAMSLTLKGRLVARGERNLFFTSLDMPEGIANLLPPGLEIIRY